MYRSKGELNACGVYVFKYLIAQRVTDIAPQDTVYLSEDEARSGYYIIYGSFPAATEWQTYISSLSRRIDEQAFLHFILSHSDEARCDADVPSASVAKSTEWILFSAIAGQKGFITYDDLVRADAESDALRANHSRRATASHRDTPGEDVFRRSRVLLTLFHSLDTNRDGKLLFRDVKGVLGGGATTST